MSKSYKHIIRIAGSDLDGSKKIGFALTRIKGIGIRIAHIILGIANISPDTRLGFLSDQDIKKIEDIIKNPQNYPIPSYMMNRQKDIFDLFRDNQHKLDERPPLHTWRHLEQRLHQHRRRNRLSLYRSLAMVAAVLVLVIFIALFSSLLHRNEGQLMAAGQTPLELEALETTTQDVVAYQAVEATRSYQERPEKTIEEEKG